MTDSTSQESLFKESWSVRRDAGRSRRTDVALEEHAQLPAPDQRADPLALLTAQDEHRQAHLVPIRHGRMSATPFTFYRGAAAVMASDLALTATTGLIVQLCGDAHLSNFGLFHSPDRRLVFDLNDFDETAPGPFEWDLKRLAASVTVAGRNNEVSAKKTARATRAVVRGYRETMAEAARVNPLELNYHRNREQDHTELLDQAAAAFDYEACRGEMWNPEAYSLLYGTPVWEQASKSQRVLLNQLYWVAYYSQIISAEVATILFNQTSAAGLYALEDFRLVCDMLDLESNQERAHIDAFKKVAEAVEAAVFGERIFTFPMRGPFAETMISDHSAVNGKAGALAQKLNLTPEDNDVSRTLVSDAQRIKDELSQKRGQEFDQRFHRAGIAPQTVEHHDLFPKRFGMSR